MMPDRRGVRIAVLTDAHRRPGDVDATKRLRAVVGRFGATVVTAGTDRPLSESDVDLALALGVDGPKRTHVPTFVVVEDGMEVYDDPARFRDLMTYDGFLTLSDSVASWLRNVVFGLRKLDGPVGMFAVTPPRDDLPRPVPGEDLVFLGRPGDDAERDAILTELAGGGGLRLFGTGWERSIPSAAAGMAEGDAVGFYQTAAAGLWLDAVGRPGEAVLTSRLLDIVAAGVPCICPWSAELEGVFGDALLYIDTDAPAGTIAWQIERYRRWAVANRDDARNRAMRAHDVFRERYALDRLFPRLLDLHEGALQRRRAWQDATAPVTIAVLARDGADVGARVAATIAALDCQNGMRREVITVVWGDAGTTDPERTGLPWCGPGVTGMRLPAGTRCDALWAALRAIRGRPGFFCILEAGDRPYPEHLSSLLAAMRRIDGLYWHGPVRLAYGGAVHDDPDSGGAVHFQVFAPSLLEDPLTCESAPGFLARTDLLDDEVMDNPGLTDGEELYLWLLLAERTFFAFSGRVTLALSGSSMCARSASADTGDRLVMRFLGRSTMGETPYSLVTRRSDGTVCEAYLSLAHRFPAFRLRYGQPRGASPNRLEKAAPETWPVWIAQPDGLPIGIYRLSAYFAEHWTIDALFICLDAPDGGARAIPVPVTARAFGDGVRLDGEFELRQAEGPVRLSVEAPIPGKPPPLAVGLWKLDRPLTYRLSDLAAYDSVWIFGAGGGGRMVLHAMAAAELPRPEGILDTFATGDLEGILIHRLEEVAPVLDERCAVVIASQYWLSIHAALREAGVRNIFSAYPFNRDLVYRLDEWP